MSMCKLWPQTVLLSGVASLLGCGDDPVIPPPPAPVPAVAISAVADTLNFLGDQLSVTATITDANTGAPISSAVATWTSLDPAVATVTASGAVTSVAVGAARIVATYQTAGDTVTIQSRQVPGALTATPTDTVVAVTETVSIAATVTDSGGTPITAGVVTYASGDSGVATVDTAGVVTAIAPGTTQITVAATPSQAVVNVTVLPVGITGRAMLSNRPFGATAGSDGFVSRLDAAAVARIDVATESVSNSITVGSVPTATAVSADGATVYVTNQSSGNIGVIDVASNAQTATINVAGSPFMVIADASNVFATTNMGMVYRISTANHAVLDSVDVGGATNGAAVVGSSLWVSDLGTDQLHEVDIATMQVNRSVSVGGTPQQLAYEAASGKLFLANENGWLYTVNVTTAMVTDSVMLSGGGFDVAVDSTGDSVYVTTAGSGTIDVVAVTSGAVIRTITSGGTPRRIAFILGTNRAIVANEAGWVDFIN